MTQEQRHPYSRISVESTPEQGGLLYLYALENLVWVQWDANLRARLNDLYERFPDATDFIFSTCQPAEGEPRAQKLRSAYYLADRKAVNEPRALSAAAGR